MRCQEKYLPAHWWTQGWKKGLLVLLRQSAKNSQQPPCLATILPWNSADGNKTCREAWPPSTTLHHSSLLGKLLQICHSAWNNQSLILNEQFQAESCPNQKGLNVSRNGGEGRHISATVFSFSKQWHCNGSHWGAFMSPKKVPLRSTFSIIPQTFASTHILK